MCVVWVAMTALPCPGAEDAWKFLDGLRQRGYYDIALDYLERLGADTNCPDDLKQVLDYEFGATLIDSSRVADSLDARQQQLDQARARFEKFLKEHPRHARAADAGTQLARVLLERGRIKMELAASPARSPAEKRLLAQEARQLFQEARKTFEGTEAKLREVLKGFESVPLDEKRDAARLAERDQARAQFVQTRLAVASAVYEIGNTYDPGSQDRNKQLQEAARAFHDLFEKYGKYAGGLYARMWEGRAYKDLGDTNKALAIFKEMLTIPNTPEAFRTLKDQSLILLLETCNQAKEYQDTLTQVKAWEAAARGDEKSSPDGLAIQYEAGVAALESARAVGEGADEYRARIAEARRYLDFVTRFPGVSQRKSRELTAASPELGGVRVEEPKTYEEARDRGDSAWGTLVVLLGKISQATDPQEREKLVADKNLARDDAIRFYRQSMALKPADADLRELNADRFRLAYLYWDAADYERAAVMGDFLARQYPDSQGARKAAEIAVKAYRVLFAAARSGEDRHFELERLNRMADYMLKLWPDQPESDEALMMLIDTAIEQRDLAKAADYLARIPAASSRRGPAELRTGQALWAAYIRSASLPEDERPKADELDRIVKQAQDMLRQGIGRMRKAVDDGAVPDYALLCGVLSLAQILDQEGQYEQSVRWLDDPKIGPMTLVNAGSPLTDREDFKTDAYKEALRAYVGTRQLDKAQNVMSLLEKTMGAKGDAETNRRLTQIYIRLGRGLQEELLRLRQENKVDQVQSVSKSFVSFLEAISKRAEGNSFSSLHWVAETYFGLGAGLDPGGRTLPPESQQYYKKAAETFRLILDRCKAEPAFAPQPAVVAGVQLRLAASLRELGQYDEAMKLLVAVLSDKENRLDAQVEAAFTYEEWGWDRPGYYELAIRGGHEKDGRYLVWGWGGIANRVASLDKYRSTFHQARYHLALCRFYLAETQTGNQRLETLKQAKLDITRIQRLYPDMGGDEWTPKYDGLLKKIQKLLGEEPAGLKGQGRPSVANSRQETASK